MGARITLLNEGVIGGESVADIQIEASSLQGIETPPDIAPSMIDEYPILMIACALAQGRSRLNGIGELRVKESDRIAAMQAGLEACGIKVRSGPDWIEIEGSGGDLVAGGAGIATQLDHRIAMSFLVLGTCAKNPVILDDASPIATSFPGFVDLMQHLGACIETDVTGM
jgi:3-phosphoshikimate 1-carboxyvinyltransferase